MPIFRNVCVIIKEAESIEKYIAIKNAKIVKHVNKWKRKQVCANRENIDQMQLEEYCRNYINNL